MKNIFDWKREIRQEKGVLIGCDSNQEWLLPWWWERYSAKNDFPVTFVDLGMTENAKKWCQERGEVIALSMDASFLGAEEEISLKTTQKCEKLYGPEFWKGLYGQTLPTMRQNWFKKPFVCLLSSYETAIWIDLDCEILGHIGDLFSLCTKTAPLALVSEPETRHFQLYPGVFYNGGVIVFAHNAKIISLWAEAAIVRNDNFWSDDNLLSALIHELRFPIVELPEVYNWKFTWGVNMNAIIYHWFSNTGKAFIKKYGGIKPALQAF